MNTIHSTAGHVVSGSQRLDVMLVVDLDEATGQIHLWLRDPRKSRGGELMILDQQGWDDLKAAIGATDERIRQLSSGKPIRLVLDGFRLLPPR